MRALQPPGWPRGKGYSHGIEASGRLVFTAGQIGWDADGALAADLAGQVRQTLANVLAVLGEAGAGPEHVARLTWYVTSRDEYVGAAKEIGEAYRDVMGRVYPAMAVVAVTALVEPDAKVEIEATAVVP